MKSKKARSFVLAMALVMLATYPMPAVASQSEGVFDEPELPPEPTMRLTFYIVDEAGKPVAGIVGTLDDNDSGWGLTPDADTAMDFTDESGILYKDFAPEWIESGAIRTLNLRAYYDRSLKQSHKIAMPDSSATYKIIWKQAPPPLGIAKPQTAGPEPPAPEARTFNRGSIPKWEDLRISEQFGTAAYNGEKYHMENRGARINAAFVGEYIGRAAAEGGREHYFEHDPDLILFHGCDVFALKNVSPECAVAIKYDGYSGFFTFSNGRYSPETLGDFVADLNLRENLVVNYVGYTYREQSADGKGIYKYDQYEPPEMSVIWNMLFFDLSIKNAGPDHHHDNKMGMAVDVKTIGESNISLGVNEDGYLQTNILRSGKSFYIGKDRVNAFINYVRKNCKLIPQNVIALF
jgi:hypothetical protein